MELKAGYKQTEVGIIPEDWEVEKFSNITTVITCGLAATPIYVSEAIGSPFLSAQNVRNGKVVYNNHKFISRELFVNITKHNKPRKGDILYTRVGAGIGEAGVIEDDYEFGIYVSLTLIKVDIKKANSYFINHLLNSDRYKLLAKNTQLAGGGVQNLNVEVVRNFNIPVPSLLEQTAIATALSDVDALITALDKLIAKKHLIKQGAMQELLSGKKRLDGFSGEWEVKKLGEVCELITKGTTPTSVGSDFKNDGINFIKIESLEKNGIIIQEKLAFISLDTHNLLKRSQLKANDILFSIAGALGRVAIVENNIIPANTNQALAIIRLNNKETIYFKFLYYFLNSEKIQKHIQSISVQGAQANLSLLNIFDLQIEFSSYKEQTTIAQILSDMDNEIEALEKRRAKTLQIKHGMMQELLTGKTRLI